MHETVQMLQGTVTLVPPPVKTSEGHVTHVPSGCRPLCHWRVQRGANQSGCHGLLSADKFVIGYSNAICNAYQIASCHTFAFFYFKIHLIKYD